MIAIVLSLVAAAMNATASVLQRLANRNESDQRGSTLRMLLDLIHRPAWIAGIVAMMTGFLVEAAALTLGRLAMVEPLMIAELPLTLIGATMVLGRRYSRRAWVAIGGLSVGLAVFVFALGPEGGDPGAVPLSLWLLAGIPTAAFAIVCVVLGWRWRRPRAALLGVATGTTFGLMSALISGAGAAYSHGGFGLLLTSWQTYAAIVVGPTSFFLLQNALQAGGLVASQPGFTLLNPLVSVLWGVLVFGETIRGGAWFIVAVVAAVGLVAATLLLVRLAELPGADSDSSGDTDSDPDRNTNADADSGSGGRAGAGARTDGHVGPALGSRRERRAGTA